MLESVYCKHCGREFSPERGATGGDASFCSAECLMAAGKQDLGQGERQPERFLVSGRSPWGR
ncbi:MAG: hypothetical protein LLF90_01410 [Methanomicrobiaceae archaeon]|nr:hypothetical protein [Methanomicrobiaceae archaeon]